MLFAISFQLIDQSFNLMNTEDVVELSDLCDNEIEELDTENDLLLEQFAQSNWSESNLEKTPLLNEGSIHTCFH